MVVSSASEAEANAKCYTANQPGQCLKYTRTWLEIDAYYGDAATAWRNAKHKHPGDRHPPAGAPVLWTGGSNGYGHAALSLGGGKIRTTDATHSGQTSTQDLSWPEQAWGLTYGGWSEDLNTTTIPYLAGGGSSGGGDDMPSRATASSSGGPWTIKKGVWRDVGWGDVSGAPFTKGKPGASVGGSTYISYFAATVAGGGVVMSRVVEYDDGTQVEGGRTAEHVATSGNTLLIDTRTGYCGKGRQLRWQLTADTDCTFTSVGVQLLWW